MKLDIRGPIPRDFTHPDGSESCWSSEERIDFVLLCYSPKGSSIWRSDRFALQRLASYSSILIRQKMYLEQYSGRASEQRGVYNVTVSNHPADIYCLRQSNLQTHALELQTAGCKNHITWTSNPEYISDGEVQANSMASCRSQYAFGGSSRSCMEIRFDLQ